MLLTSLLLQWWSDDDDDDDDVYYYYIILLILILLWTIIPITIIIIVIIIIISNIISIVIFMTLHVSGFLMFSVTRMSVPGVWLREAKARGRLRGEICDWQRHHRSIRRRRRYHSLHSTSDLVRSLALAIRGEEWSSIYAWHAFEELSVHLPSIYGEMREWVFPVLNIPVFLFQSIWIYCINDSTIVHTTARITYAYIYIYYIYIYTHVYIYIYILYICIYIYIYYTYVYIYILYYTYVYIQFTCLVFDLTHRTGSVGKSWTGASAAHTGFQLTGSRRGTPSHHPFRTMGFSRTPSSDKWDPPMTVETSKYEIFNDQLLAAIGGFI